MIETANEAAKVIREHENDSITLVSHMDADGISSAAILSKALDREEIRHRVKFVRMLYPEVVEELDTGKLTIFTDLGSSQLKNLKPKFNGRDVVIIDHHYPGNVDEWDDLIHFNAHLEGLDGVGEVSGSGMSYLVSKKLDTQNKDLSSLGLIGAIGDVQNAWGELKGYNRKIAEDGIETGKLKQEKDLLLYGRHTRPIFRVLKNFTDPPIPGVSNSVEGSVSMLKDLGIPYRTNEGFRRPVDLNEEEKKKLASELITRAISEVPGELVDYVPGLIIGEVHTLLDEKENTFLRGADEFSTCINSTARHEQPLIGLEVAKGDRDVYHRQMVKLLKYHRRCIAEGMNHIREKGIEKGPEGYLQHFDASDVLRETFIGTVASLTLGHEKAAPYKPIAGIVKHDGVAKISARCSKLLFPKGLDLGEAIRNAAKAVGGEGGGHAVASGAQIGEDRVNEFIGKFEEEIVKSL